MTHHEFVSADMHTLRVATKNYPNGVPAFYEKQNLYELHTKYLIHTSLHCPDSWAVKTPSGYVSYWLNGKQCITPDEINPILAMEKMKDVFSDVDDD